MNNYDVNKISSYLSCLDANNLYGLTMCVKLPYGNLERSNDIKPVDDIMSYKDWDVGYML